MQYFASHYWQTADEKSPSLLLQQVYHKQKNIPVVFACVCDSRTNPRWGKSMLTRLTDWFYEKGLFLAVRKGGKGILGIRRELERYLNQEEFLPEDLELSGIFCVENALFLWKRGEGRIWLSNQKNLNPHISELHPEEMGKKGILFQNGFIQKEVGILLGTNSLGQPKPADVRGWKDSKQMEKYLQEIGEQAARRGKEKIGAIFLMTK